MNWNPLKTSLALATLALPLGATAQTVLSNFSDLQGDGTVTFLDTWTDAGTDQYTQNASDISITQQGAGNPKAYGSFLVAGVTLDLSNFSNLEISARAGAGNLSDTFNVVFYNDDGLGGIGASSFYTFNSSDFAGLSFATQSASISSPTFTENEFDPTAVTYWSIEGDYLTDPVTGPDFRFDFNNLQLTPIPEPATWALLAIGAGAFWMRRKKPNR